MKVATRPRTQQQKAKVIQPQPSVVVGLCGTCDNAAECVYRRRRGFDALFCEMFDAIGSNGNGGDRATAVVIVEKEPDTQASLQVKGLCVNCVHRDVCKLPRPAEGVWHCEEYA